MKIIVGVQKEQGVELVGNLEGTAPLTFENEQEALDFMVKESKMPEEFIKMLFQFYELTDEELADLIAKNAE